MFDVKTRVHTVKVRMSAAELAAAERNAAGEGVPLATYMRRLSVTARGGAGNEERVKRALALLGTLSRPEADAIRSNVMDVREAWSRGRR